VVAFVYSEMYYTLEKGAGYDYGLLCVLHGLGEGGCHDLRACVCGFKALEVAVRLEKVIL